MQCEDCGSTGHDTGSNTCPGPEVNKLENPNAKWYPSEYDELKATGLTDDQIRMLRNFGATHAAILAYARQNKHPLSINTTN